MSSTTHLQPQYSSYNFDPSPNENDGFSELRLPTDWLRWAEALIYYDWYMFSQGVEANAGDVNLEKAVFLNALNGKEFLLTFDAQEDCQDTCTMTLVDRAHTILENLEEYLCPLGRIEELFHSNRLRYATQEELESLSKQQNRECPICCVKYSKTPSDAWRDKWALPTVLFPDLIGFLPLGTHNCRKYDVMANDLWDCIERGYIDSYDSHEMLACCRSLGAEIKRYTALSDAEKNAEEGIQTRHCRSHKGSTISEALARYPPVPAVDPEEQIVVTACEHCVGIFCLGDWISQGNSTCPICMAPLAQPTINWSELTIDQIIPSPGFEAYFTSWTDFLDFMSEFYPEPLLVPKNLRVGRADIIDVFHHYQ